MKKKLLITLFLPSSFQCAKFVDDVHHGHAADDVVVVGGVVADVEQGA